MTDIHIEAVKKVQNGDRDAFALLFEEFSKPVYFQVSSIVQEKQDIDDIVSDIFAAALEKIGSLNTPEAFPAWLKTIASNKSIDYIRNKQSSVSDKDDASDDFELFEEMNPALIPDKALDNAETARIIYEIIQQLPLPQRSCIYFYYYEGLKVTEIAEKLAVSENTIKRRLSLAREKIKEELERREEKDGLRLWMATPLMLVPILKFAFQNTQVPESLAGEIVGNLGITTPLSAAPEAITGVSTASVGTSSTATFGAGKIIAACVAGVVVVGGVIAGTVLLGNSDNEPVVTPSNVIAATATPSPTATPIVIQETPTLSPDPTATPEASTPSPVSTIDPSTEPWREAYIEFLVNELENSEQYQNKEYWYYTLADLDGDGIPEILLGEYIDRFDNIYIFTDDEVKKVSWSLPPEYHNGLWIVFGGGFDRNSSNRTGIYFKRTALYRDSVFIAYQNIRDNNVFRLSPGERHISETIHTIYRDGVWEITAVYEWVTNGRGSWFQPEDLELTTGRWVIDPNWMHELNREHYYEDFKGAVYNWISYAH